MYPTLLLDEPDVLPTAPDYSFAVRRSPELPTYQELVLEDAQGHDVRWVISQPLRQLAKRPVLLWLLASTPLLGALASVEDGPVQLAPARPGSPTDLATELAGGVLRLNFNGQQLRGYFRLQRLPTGCGQLWQLTPIGNV
jgi:hypothetical protein